MSDNVVKLDIQQRRQAEQLLEAISGSDTALSKFVFELIQLRSTKGYAPTKVYVVSLHWPAEERIGAPVAVYSTPEGADRAANTLPHPRCGTYEVTEWEVGT